MMYGETIRMFTSCYNMFKSNNTKQFINGFIAGCQGKETRAIVIDAEELRTSRSLMEVGVPPNSITVLNTDQGICDKAHTLGLKTACGMSTTTLRQLYGRFNLIYLDYCGFPTKHANGFDPAFDLLWAADHIDDDGIVIATFCRRAKHCIETAENLIPTSLRLAKTHVYFESSAMMCMFLVKKNERTLRDRINRALITAPPQVPPPPQVSSAEYVKGSRKRKKRHFLMNDQASEWHAKSEKKKPKKAEKAEKPDKKYVKGTAVSVEWEDKVLPGIVIKKIYGGYNIYFPLTNDKACVRTNAVSQPTSNC